MGGDHRSRQHPGVFAAEPDTTDNYEIGLKGYLGPVRFAASGYYINWDGIQANISVTDIVIPGVVNVGDGYSRGIDLEATYASDRILIHANYSYNDSKFETLNDAILAEASTTLTVGGRFPGVSNHTASLRAEYTIPDYMGYEAKLGASATYQSDQAQTVSADAPTIDGFSMLNLYALVSKDSWRLRVYVDNVFDELGITSAQDPASYSFGYFSTVSRPRTAGVTLTYVY